MIKGLQLFSTVALLVMLASPTPAAAQQRPPAPAGRDTAAARDSVGISPRGALLRSFAIPGWGQAYAGAPGRGAFYFAMEAGSLWMVYKTKRQLGAARVRDAWLREQKELRIDQISGLTRSRAQQFEDWVTLAIFIALFSGADAYVSAQLADFAENIGVRPVASGLELRADLPLPRAR